MDFKEETYKIIRGNLCSESHRLILDISVFTGARWSEILALRTSDICREKGKYQTITFKDRKVEVPSALGESLHYFDRFDDNTWLFPSPHVANKPISLRSTTNALRRAIDKSGLKFSGLSPKDIRTYYIRQLISRGYNIAALKKITGLSETTLFRYANRYGGNVCFSFGEQASFCDPRVNHRAYS
ncbi:site-specific integrase [Limnofasciculus baicalensis]|uniref:Site-specific integrase n=1 Tax=Limnofasciculus baicalensis BBK-W-15 TaxID=2699891 RepID=A0AAE3GMX1_9CYAN|nr:site-specific integrase [Limnofasciculus baicalensis]MCP2727339.1 site-specific integrase [Limnofasciculus baicalensis BBK-W-15]